jgi:hypothetical protein
MKMIGFVLILLSVLSAAAFADDEVLVEKGTSVGFYGGPTVKVSAVDNQTAVLLGGRGAAIFSNTFIIGGGGYVLSSPVEKDVTGGLYNINLRYGGLELGVTLGSDWLMHFTSNLMLGVGNVDYENSPGDSSLLYVLEPQGYLEINALEWMRICIGGGYRFVFGVNGVREIASSDLWGPNAEIMIKFGSF